MNIWDSGNFQHTDREDENGKSGPCDAEKFYEFLISNEGQKIIADFGKEKYGEPLYHPAVIKNPK